MKKEKRLWSNEDRYLSPEFQKKWKYIMERFKERKTDYDYTEIIHVDFKKKKITKNEYIIKRKVA